MSAPGAAPMPAARQPAISARRLLVVDDDPEIAACLCTLLDDAGYRVAAAGDGQEAVARIEAERPEAVLLGPCLAPEAGRRLQAQLRRRGVDAPVIFLPAIVMGACGDAFDLPRLVQAAARLAIAASGA